MILAISDNPLKNKNKAFKIKKNKMIFQILVSLDNNNSKTSKKMIFKILLSLTLKISLNKIIIIIIFSKIKLIIILLKIIIKITSNQSKITIIVK